MRARLQPLTLSALMAALQLLLLLATSATPAGRGIGLLFLTATQVILLLRTNLEQATLTYAVVALLSLLFFPGFTTAAYVALFGSYPLFKAWLEARVTPWKLTYPYKLLYFLLSRYLIFLLPRLAGVQNWHWGRFKVPMILSYLFLCLAFDLGLSYGAPVLDRFLRSHRL